MLQQLKYTRLPVVRSFLVFIYTFSLSISSFLILFPLISQLMYLLMCTWYMQLFVWDITASITNVKCMDTERSINSCSQQGKTALRPPGNASVGGLLPGSFTFTEFCKKLFFCLFCFAFYIYLCPVHVFLSTKCLLLFCFGVPSYFFGRTNLYLAFLLMPAHFE